jgi:hypothetical protein
VRAWVVVAVKLLLYSAMVDLDDNLEAMRDLVMVTGGRTRPSHDRQRLCGGHVCLHLAERRCMRSLSEPVGDALTGRRWWLASGDQSQG